MMDSTLQVFYRKVEEAVEDAAAGVNVNAKLLTLLQCKVRIQSAAMIRGPSSVRTR